MQTMQWRYLDRLTPDGLTATLHAFQTPQDSDAPAVLALLCEQEQQQGQGVVLLQQVATALSIALVGVLVPGVIVDTQVQRQGVLLIAFDAGVSRQIFAMPRVGNTTTDAAVETLSDFVATYATESGGDTLLLFVDSLIPDVASLLDRLYLAIGDQVNYVGTLIGSETFQSVPCLFDNTVFVRDAVLALLLPQHPGAILAHHYRGGEALSVATATAGSRIATIDGQPAFEVYRALTAREYGIDLNRDNFYRHAVHFPFAISRAQGESLVRIPVLVEENGAVFCNGEVKENSLLSVVRAVEPGNLDTAQQVGAEVRSENPAGVLTFYCAGRFLHLEETYATAELAALAHAIAPAPLLGLLSLGEIGSGRQQYPAFHNATIVALPWL